jgi:hypothetical protein
MATTQQQVTYDGTTIQDVDAIAEALQLYIDGAAQGDAAKLAEGFHPDAQMYGTCSGQRFDMPITEYVKHATSHPADVGGTYRARITSIVQVGDAASATVLEENHLGMDFVDFLTLCRMEGRWQIVNKTFAHTAGEMLAAE